MQIQLEVAAIVTVVITILGAIIAFTRYLTQLQSKLENIHLTHEKLDLDHRLRDIMARYDQLLNQIAASQKPGPLALATRINIENDLLEIMGFLDAEAGSVYIPVRSERTHELVGLVFLSILPMNSESSTLLKKIIPMKSLAGEVFRTGEVNVYRKSAQVQSHHFNQADEASGFVTRDAITLPLRDQGNIVGVLQLLNRKEGKLPFNEKDFSLVETFTRNLSGKVAEYCKYPDHLSLLGISSQKDLEIGTIMFCDLTNSALLFKSMDSSNAIQHINEFLTVICDVAFDYGATIDKYTGDGVFLRFNVPIRVDNHENMAIQASIEMRKKFIELKKQWFALDNSVAPIHLRISLALGLVHQATIGHPQSQYVTLFGTPVNVAANLCEAADRQSNVIIIDESLYNAVGNTVRVKMLDKEDIGKAILYTDVAYEVIGFQNM